MARRRDRARAMKRAHSTAAAVVEPEARSSRATMRELAACAGVHQTTVSRVLRNDPAVAAATRERVRAIAAELGYVPDPQLDAFNLHRLSTRPRRSAPAIAWIEDGPARPGSANDLAREAARAEAARLGLVLERFELGAAAGQLAPARLRQIVEARAIDGVILAALTEKTRALALHWPRLCALKIESFHVGPELDTVAADHRAAGQLAVAQLRRLGCRRIGLAVTRREDQRLNSLARAGYLAETAGLGAEIPTCWIGDRAEVRAVRAWSEAHRLDAVASDDVRLLAELRRAPRRARRLSLAALDVTGAGPELAGVLIDHGAVGAWAVRLVELRRVTNQRDLPPRNSVSYLPVSWRDGSSASPGSR